MYCISDSVFVSMYFVQAEEERGDMEKVKLDNKRILFNLLPAHVAQHFLMSNPRNMVSLTPSPLSPVPEWVHQQDWVISCLCSGALE